MECHKACEHCSTVSRVEWVPSWILVGEREIFFFGGKAPVEVWALLYQISNRFQLVSRSSEPSTGTIVVSGKAFNHQDFIMLFPFVCLHLFFLRNVTVPLSFFSQGIRNQALAMLIGWPTWRSNPHPFWQKNPH